MKRYLFLFLIFLFVEGVSAQTKQQIEALQNVISLLQKKGKIVFYATKQPDCEVSFIGISINGKTATIKRFDEMPSCRNADPSAYPTFELPPGTYKFTGLDMCGNKYYGNVTISSGECKLFKVFIP